ncbi:substrate-binding domain-containing protein [Streptomyces hebeiensis]
MADDPAYRATRHPGRLPPADLPAPGRTGREQAGRGQTGRERAGWERAGWERAGWEQSGRHGARRPTIGLVTANIHLGVGATLWSGALRAAERADVNLVCFPGGPLRHGDVPRSALYELVGPARLDGVVCWSSTLGLPAGSERADRLTRRLAHLPVVSLNQPLSAGQDTLTVDSYAGMRDAVGHLVEHHGRRRVACIRGPLANPVSQERHRACVEALGRLRVPYDRALTCAAVDFTAGAGAAAMRVLTEARGLVPGVDFDAVVAGSDVLAADALRVLTARGIRVPEDVSVVGFNDSPEARLSDPPLTSVALPFAELGALAVDTLVARLRWTRPPDRTAVPGTLVVRRSCGCHSPLVAQAGREAVEATGPGAAGNVDPFTLLPHAGDRLAAAFHADTADTADAGATNTGAADPGGTGASDDTGTSGSVGPGAPVRPAGAGSGSVGTFLPLLERLLGADVRTPKDVAAWDGALERLRGRVLAALPADRGRYGALLLGQARLMVAEKAHRLLEYERWSQGQLSQRLLELGTALTTVVDTETLGDVLERHADTAGMPRCRVVLYEEGERRPDLPPVQRLARVLPSGAERAGSGGDATPNAGFPAALLLPDRLLPDPERFALVLEPLHIGDDHLGFAVFDARTAPEAERAGAVYRALGDQISAALKGVRLFDEVRRARDAAEQASRFKTRLLGHVTQELRTPVEALLRHPGATSGGAFGLAGQDAAHLLHLIDNLLDLSRSEADDLEPTRRLEDPAPLLARAFRTAADGRTGGDAWTLDLPDRLPSVPVDGARLGRLVGNLLSAAAFQAGADGGLTLAARPGPASVRITVGSSRAVAGPPRPGAAGPLATSFPAALSAPLPPSPPAGPMTSLPPGPSSRTSGNSSRTTEGSPRASNTRPRGSASAASAALPAPRPPGQGRGADSPGARAAEIALATAQRLAMLHGGSLAVDRSPGRLRLDLDLPLPTPDGRPGPAARPGDRLLVVAPGPPAPALRDLADQHGLLLCRPTADDDLDALVADARPAAVAWDAGSAGPDEWPCVQRLHDDPRLRHTPFLLFGAEGPDLSRALRALRPGGPARPVIAAATTVRYREACVRLAAAALPDHPLRIAPDGTTALGLVAEETPALILLERTLPDMHALDVVDHMDHGNGRPPCPVVVLGDRGFSAADARRAEPHRALLLLDHTVLGHEEAAALLGRMARERPAGRDRSRAPVHTALVFLYEHYRHRISRWQVAEAAGVSADHLGRLFHRSYGVTVWEYLIRLRVRRAGDRLRLSGDSVHSVARSVGFQDRAYFSRVFRRVTGASPHAYRDSLPG